MSSSYHKEAPEPCKSQHTETTQNKHKHVSTIRKTQNHKSFQEKEQHPKKQTTHTTKTPRKARHVKLTKRTNKKDKLLGEKMHIEMGSHFILIYVCYVLPWLWQLNQAKPTSNGSGTWVPPTKIGTFQHQNGQVFNLCHWIMRNCCDFNGQYVANKCGKKNNTKLWTTILVEVGFQKETIFFSRQLRSQLSMGGWSLVSICQWACWCTITLCIYIYLK